MKQPAIEAGARALVRHAWAGSCVVDGDALAASGDFDSKYRDDAAAVITAYEAHLKAEGFVVVPKEPTPEMNAAAFDLLPTPVQVKLTKLWGWPGHAAIYRAMIAAAAQEPSNASD